MIVVLVVFATLMVPCWCRTDTFYFSSWPEDGRPCVGSSLRLPCSVSDNKSISLRWTRNHKPLSAADRLAADGVGLWLSLVQPGDSGQYACIAHNTTSGFSLTSLPATIDVLWVGVRSLVTVVGRQKADPPPVEGQTIVLRCRVDGGPGLYYVWYRNGEQLPMKSSSKGRKRLILTKVSAGQHNGAYTCTALLSAAKLTRNDPIDGGPDKQLCGGRQQSLLSVPYVLALQGASSPRVLEYPKPLLQAAGSDASFNCSFDGNTSVTWTYPQQARGSVSVVNGSLTISNVSFAVEGYYTCRGGAPRRGRRQAFGAQLKVAFISPTGPLLQPSPEGGLPLAVAEGTAARVRCLPPEGLPVPSVGWSSHAGDALPNTGRLRAEKDELVLEVASLAKTLVRGNRAVPEEEQQSPPPFSRELNFLCTAHNIAGASSSPFAIVVTRRPEASLSPHLQQAEEGETIKLECQVAAAGAPLTTIYWSKDEDKITIDGQRMSTWERPGSAPAGEQGSPSAPAGEGSGTKVVELRIRWLQPSDSGQYCCNVLTKGHQPVTSQPATVQVIERLRFSPAPENGRVAVGGSTSLQCGARSHVTPTITWTRLKPQGGAGTPLPAGLAVTADGNLTVQEARRQHDGWYQCSASTPHHHRPINASVRLLVTEVPGAEIPAGELLMAVQGQPLAVPCSVTGQPAPHVNWRRTPSLPHSWWVDGNGSLRSAHVSRSDEGLYTCQASNIVGTATAHVNIAVTAGIDGRAELKRTMSIAVGGAALYLSCVVALLLYCRYRRLRAKRPVTPPRILTPGSDTSHRLSSSLNYCGTESSPCSLEQSVPLQMMGSLQHCDGDSMTHTNLGSKESNNLDPMEHNKELSVIYSSRLYGAAEGDEDHLQIPLNFPKPSRNPRRSSSRRLTNRRTRRARSSAGNNCLVRSNRKKKTRSMEQCASSLDQCTSSMDQCTSELDLRRQPSRSSDHLRASYLAASWSTPFHLSRPPEPTSLDPIL